MLTKTIQVVLVICCLLAGKTLSGQVIADYSYADTCSRPGVQFTDLSTTVNNFIVSWAWNFGDPSSGTANTSNLQNPSHEYSSAGTYSVSVTVTDDLGSSGTVTKTISVLPSPAANFSFTAPCDGNAVQFADLSIGPGPDTVVAWSWSFGDLSSSAMESPSKLYGAANTYTVLLEVTASNGCRDTAIRSVKVHAYPVVLINTDQVACLNVPEPFSDLSYVFNGSINSWHWTFPAATDSVPLTSYSFDSSGTFVVTLALTTDGGCISSASKSVQVVSGPVAAFTPVPVVGNPPLIVSFNNQSTAAVTYSWDFGNGNISALVSPVFTFSDTGYQQIILTAFSVEGCTDTASAVVLVTEPYSDIALIDLLHSVQGNIYTIGVRVANYGNTPIYGFDLVAEFGGDGAIIEHFSDTILQNSDRLIFFNGKLEIESNSEAGFVCVNSRMQDPDANLLNNKQCRTLTGDFFFSNPYPNPVHDETVLEFILPEAGNLEIGIFDMLGKQVRSMKDGLAPRGLYTFRTSLNGMRNGVYTIRASYGDETVVKRILKY